MSRKTPSRPGLLLVPIVKFGQRLVYFAHVSKAGGTGIVEFLAARGGLVAFEDQQYMTVAQKYRWSKTSPQHIDLDSLTRLVPASFFDASFAVVRHPVDRLVSVFHYQMEVEQRIWPRRDFSKWLRRLESATAKRPYIYDNHVRPMNDLVPSGAMVFYLENGLDLVVPWLDALVGNSSHPRTIGTVNIRKERSVAKAEPSKYDLRLIAELYHVDFERFGYNLDDRVTPVNGERPATAQSTAPPLRFGVTSVDSLGQLVIRVIDKIRTKSRTMLS